MSLDIHLFKDNIDFRKIRKDIDILYEKRRNIQDELEQLEDEYSDAELSAFNITHNLGKMAQEVGLYDVLWNSEEIGITIASQMILPLEEGINELEKNPNKYKAFDAPNGWGRYEDFLEFCKSILQKCREYPEAIIEVSK
ncbi:MAG: hypothetical protein LBV72_05515 [Tannerella sp.]|jgi:septation ring formation regulator EzrA|nr:hypothetical protein [Tannerella sp.]